MEPEFNEIWEGPEQQYLAWLKGVEEGSESIENKIFKSVFFYFREQVKQQFIENNILAFEKIKKDGLADEKNYIGSGIKERRVSSSKAEFFPDSEASIDKYFKRFLKGKKKYQPDIRFSLEEPESDYSSNKLLVEGDQKIFNDIYEEAFPSVLRHVIRNSGKTEDARDVFQDALVLLIEKLKRGKIDSVQYIDSWVKDVSVKLWYKKLGERKKEIPILKDQLPDDDKIEIIFEEYPDLFEQVKLEIEKIGETCRKLIELCYFYNKNWEQIKDEMGYTTAANARNQKYKCLEKIRRKLN